MEKFGPFIINEWLRLIEPYTVEYPRNSRGSQSINILSVGLSKKQSKLAKLIAQSSAVILE